MAQTIGKYQVEKVLGRGGMGTVYEALDPVIHRKVALKTMIPGLADAPDLRARFLREAQAAGGLRHRNIVTVYDLGEDKGQPYIAMEFIEGTDLEKVIQSRQGHSVEWKLDILRQVCEGLAYAHRSGIVHRDIKPANIRVTPEGEVKIMDFGIAHLQSSTMTKSGLVLGTVHYMAPEQVEGHKVDHRADIFSVGAIAYELIAYRKPFDGDSLTAVMFKIMRDRPDPDVLPRTDYSPGLETVIMKALSKNVAERYQSLDDMRDDLARLVKDTASRSPQAPPPTQTAGPAVPPVPATPANMPAPTPEPKTVAVPTTTPSRARRPVDTAAIDRERADRLERLVEAGRRQMAAGNMGKAFDCVKQALALAPDDETAKALAQAVETESVRRRVERETAEIRAALERARAEGQLQKAQVLCKRLIELDPDDKALAAMAAEIDGAINEKEVEQLSGMALSYATDGDMDLALKIAGKIERIAPNSPKYRELKSYLTEESARRTAETLVAAAREHLAQGNLDEARVAAEDALAAYPAHNVAREIRDRVRGIVATREKAARAAAAPPPAAPEALPPAESAPAAPAVAEDQAPTPVPAARASRAARRPASPADTRPIATVPLAPAEPVAEVAAVPDTPAAGPEPPPVSEPLPTPGPPAVIDDLPQDDLVARPLAPPLLTPLPEGPPGNPEAAALVEAARRHLKERSSQKAVPLLEQALALEPGHPGIQRVLEVARVDARKAEAANLTTAALNHFVSNNYAKSRKAVEKALALEPENKKAKELLMILGTLG
jgi:tetratricopeptide (TPR) repeat protein/predicted Ser/Thr protein kinase